MAKSKTDAKFTAATVAEKIGITAAEFRKHLRALGIKKPAAGWNWDKSPADIIKQVQNRIKELATAPAKAPAKKAAKKASAKKSESKSAPKKKARKVRKAKKASDSE